MRDQYTEERLIEILIAAKVSKGALNSITGVSSVTSKFLQRAGIFKGAAQHFQILRYAKVCAAVGGVVSAADIVMTWTLSNATIVKIKELIKDKKKEIEEKRIMYQEEDKSKLWRKG